MNSQKSQSEADKSKILNEIKAAYEGELKIKDEQLEKREIEIEQLENQVEELNINIDSAHIELAEIKGEAPPP